MSSENNSEKIFHYIICVALEFWAPCDRPQRHDYKRKSAFNFLQIIKYDPHLKVVNRLNFLQ
jgi:hypothetical protein